LNSNYNYRQFSVLFVDDEQQTAENFQEYFSDTFEIQIATSAEQGWELFQANPDKFAIVVTDQRMPGGSGTDLLEKVKASRPRVLRILATAYSDLEAAIKAVNTGAIYKYVTKPWDPPTFEINLMRGMEFFLVQRERDYLLHEKMSALQRLMMTDRLVSLGIFASGLNHHLRNSLSAVKTFLDLAPFKLQSENLDLNFYQTVQFQIDKIISLLQDVREIPEPPRLPLSDQVSVDGTFQRVLAALASDFGAKSIQVDFKGGNPPPILGNQSMVEKAITLLLNDETVNMNEGGLIRISTGATPADALNPGIEIKISDNGPGMNISNLSCVFDPFFVRQNLPEQYGLNLLACFFLIHHHGGSITVEANSEGGVDYAIFLPQQPAEQTPRKDEREFLQRVFDTEKAWEKILLG
jgi:two-component system probable response regulator PhcQ